MFLGAMLIDTLHAALEDRINRLGEFNENTRESLKLRLARAAPTAGGSMVVLLQVDGLIMSFPPPRRDTLGVVEGRARPWRRTFMAAALTFAAASLLAAHEG